MLWCIDDVTSHPSFSNGYDDDKDTALSYPNEKKSMSLSNARKGESFNIEVGVRFKPLPTVEREIGDDDNNEGQCMATLPLHQRLALIRRSHNLTSNSEALLILKKNGEWFGGGNNDDGNNGIENGRGEGAKIINLMGEENGDKCNKDKKQEGDNACCGEQHFLTCGIHSIDPGKKSVIIVDPIKGLRQFRFDNILPDTCTQHEVYETTARPLVGDFINGVNATCLVYGVTGSGKTFTMFGPDHQQSEKKGAQYQHDNFQCEIQGIVPRACHEIFEAIHYRKRNLNMKIDAEVSVSYIEVFGNEIGDLLRAGSPCSQNKAANHRFVLSGAAEVMVTNVKDVMKLLRIGEAQKRKAATAMNARSSRAHSIFIVTLKQVCKTTEISRTSKLFMADLGGCEQTKKSDIKPGSSKHYDRLKQEMLTTHKSDDNRTANTEERESFNSNIDGTKEYSIGFVKSDRMREAVHINLGLLALKVCVTALNSRNSNGYIPYSNSKLTMLLSSALGGNSKTSVIVCSDQEKDHTTETIAAMKFAQSCRCVQNAVECETDFLQQLIDNLDRKIILCEEEIRRKEKWIVQEERRVDKLAEEGTLEGKIGGEEIFRTTVLVGAEKERIYLHRLLQKKAELTGENFDSTFGGFKFGGAIGFGNAHSIGIGEKYNDNNAKDSYRFKETADEHEIPKAVKSQSRLGWDTGKETNVGREVTKKTALVYYGLSA